MKIALLLLLLTLQAAPLQAAAELSFGVMQQLTSKVLQEDRRYYVYLPPSYRKNNADYPLIILLDGDVHRWKAFAGMLEGLSTETLERQVKEAIVVAVPSSEHAIRERDLTPTSLQRWTFQGKLLEQFTGPTGNAAAYLTFFKNELLPQLQRQYRISSERMIVGESFGGLFSAAALLNDPTVFSHYLIIDPTAVWDDNYLNRQLKTVNFAAKAPTAQIYLAFANNAAIGAIGVTNLAWGQQFATGLAAHQSAGFSIKQQYFAAESHGTVALQAWYHGLKHLLPQQD